MRARFACRLAGARHLAAARHLTGARYLALHPGAVAIIAIAGFTAGCGNNATNNPTTTTTTTTTATTTTATTTTSAAVAPPPAAPTQKNLNPNGPNSFAPNRGNTPPPVYQNPHAHPPG
jgi:hypothetical protein